jgi:hypothetical protein
VIRGTFGQVIFFGVAFRKQHLATRGQFDVMRNVQVFQDLLRHRVENLNSAFAGAIAFSLKARYSTPVTAEPETRMPSTANGVLSLAAKAPGIDMLLP